LGRVGAAVGFLTTLGVESDFFVRLGYIIGSFLHHTPKLRIPVEMIQFLLKLLFNLMCTTISTDFNSQISYPFMLRSRKFGKVGVESRSQQFCKGRTRSWSRIFYLRLRNPGVNSCQLYLAKLVVHERCYI